MNCTVPNTLETSARRIRVFCLTEVRVYRDLLVQALSVSPSVEIIGSAAIMMPDCVDQLAEAAPDVVLVEGGRGPDKTLLSSITSTLPACRIVAFGVRDEEHEIVRYAEHGVAGFVLYDATLEQMLRTIQTAARGEFFCSARDGAWLLQRLRTLAAGKIQEVPFSLTAREKEIIALVDTGLSNKDIALRLGIELSTVKNHVHNILSKLHATRRGQAAARVRQAFLVSPPS